MSAVWRCALVIAKQMDIRSNIKKFFDMANEGEAIVVPRKGNRNVVIISESEYNRLCQYSRLSSYAQKIPDIMKSKVSGSGVKKHNIEKLRSIRSFKKNWNGNGAPAMPSLLVDTVEALINKLVIQPEIFPTALGTIQLEYDNARRDHMEIEIGESELAEVFIVMFNGEELYESIAVNAEDINRRVGEFYG